MKSELHKPREALLLLTTFCFSGISSGITLVIWFRWLNLFLGFHTFWFAIVIVAGFIAVGLGSYATGIFIDRRRFYLRCYLALEAATALCAGSAVCLLRLNSRTITPAIHGDRLFIWFYTTCFLFIASFVIQNLFVIAAAPVLGRRLLRDGALVARRLGLLFGLRTLGLAVGVVTAGVFTVRTWGLSGSMLLAASMHLVVALVVGIFLFRRPTWRMGFVPDLPTSWTTIEIPSEDERKNITTTLLGVSFSLFASVALWLRIMRFAVAFNPYSSALVSGIILSGGALGALIVAIRNPHHSKITRHINTLVLWSSIVGVNTLIIGLVIPKLFSSITRAAGDFQGWTASLIASAGGAVILLLPMTVLFGALAPLAISKLAFHPAKLGRSLGSSILVMGIGAAIGIFTAGVIFPPTLGVVRSLLLLALGTGFLAGFLNRRRSRLRNPFAASTALLALVVVVALLPLDLSSLIKQCLCNRQALNGERAPMTGAHNPDEAQLLFYKEGISVTVSVVQASAAAPRRLLVDGIEFGSDSDDSLRSSRLLGHLPMILHPDPQNILILGLGLGATAGSCSLYNPSKITVVEPSPEVVAATDLFVTCNHNILKAGNLQLIKAEGARYIRRNTAQFDIIISNAIHHCAPQSALVYNREYYDACRERLNPGGIFCQKLPLDHITSMDLKTILAGFVASFPEGQLWISDFCGILVGSVKQPLLFLDRVTELLNHEAIDRDLEEVRMNHTYSLTTSYLMGYHGLKQLSLGIPQETIDRPILDYSIPDRGNFNVESTNFRLLFDNRKPIDQRFSPDELDVGSLTVNFKELYTYSMAVDFVRNGDLLVAANKIQEAKAQYEKALEVWPAHRIALAKLSRLYLRLGDSTAPITQF